MKNPHLHIRLVPRRIYKPSAETAVLADADKHAALLLRLRRRFRCARFCSSTIVYFRLYRYSRQKRKEFCKKNNTNQQVFLPCSR
jgi:hypothetical protein